MHISVVTGSTEFASEDAKVVCAAIEVVITKTRHKEMIFFGYFIIDSTHPFRPFIKKRNQRPHWNYPPPIDRITYTSEISNKSIQQ